MNRDGLVIGISTQRTGQKGVWARLSVIGQKRNRDKEPRVEGSQGQVSSKMHLVLGYQEPGWGLGGSSLWDRWKESRQITLTPNPHPHLNYPVLILREKSKRPKVSQVYR